MLIRFLRMSFYAVANGRAPGIYKTWAECEAQVKGFSAAKYKKFKTKVDAEAFVAGKVVSQEVSGSVVMPNGKRKLDDVKESKSKKVKKAEGESNGKTVGLKTFGEYSFPVDEDDYVHVYTDGSCEGNGNVIACAGLGVYFMDGHPLNTAQPVKGRPTNNTGEIQAAIVAIKIVKEYGIKKLQINTDSMYLIQAVTSWMPTWKKKMWKKSSGGELKNLSDFMELDKCLTQDIKVRWNHVAGHVGIHGNEEADKLAREGAQMFRDNKKSKK